jgi:hypothetical protein
MKVKSLRALVKPDVQIEKRGAFGASFANAMLGRNMQLFGPDPFIRMRELRAGHRFEQRCGEVSRAADALAYCMAPATTRLTALWMRQGRFSAGRR